MEEIDVLSWSSSSAPGLDTDVDSLDSGGEHSPSASGSDAGVGPVLPEKLLDDEQAGPRVARARRFQHEVWRNMYFYIVNHPSWNDVKIRMFADWATAEHMGHFEMSKTLIPSKFGEDVRNPKRSYFLLRAWMLWRARRNGWAGARSGRRNQFAY